MQRRRMINSEIKAAMVELRRLGAREDMDVVPEAEEAATFGLPKEVLRVFDEIESEKKKRGQVFDKAEAIAAFSRFGADVQKQVIVSTPYEYLRRIDLSRHAYVSGVINEGGRADINLGILDELFSRLRGERNYTLHLLGFGKTPAYVHPKWVLRYGDKYSDSGDEIYRAGQPRPDISIHVGESSAGVKTLYGMKFTPSNFVLYGEPVTLSGLGVTLSDFQEAGEDVIEIFLNASINATEKLIQLPKNLAAVLPAFTSPDGERQTKLDLFKTAAAANDPSTQKRCGRKAQLNSRFFALADGANVDVYNPGDWNGIGTNVLIQALGGLLRIRSGDNILREFLEFCSKHRITIVEAALHGEVEIEGKKVSYGGDPDLTWGGSIVYPWMSRESAKYATGGKNHLGLGYKLLMHAMEPGEEAYNVQARRVLGLTQTRESVLEGDVGDKCRAIAEYTFGRIFRAGYAVQV